MALRPVVCPVLFRILRVEQVLCFCRLYENILRPMELWTQSLRLLVYPM